MIGTLGPWVGAIVEEREGEMHSSNAYIMSGIHQVLKNWNTLTPQTCSNQDME